jgi:hypothetical protein
MKSEIKKMKGKKVKLTYKVNGYTHIQHGVITATNSESILFEPFDFNAMPLTYGQILEVETI